MCIVHRNYEIGSLSISTEYLAERQPQHPPLSKQKSDPGAKMAEAGSRAEEGGVASASQTKVNGHRKSVSHIHDAQDSNAGKADGEAEDDPTGCRNAFGVPINRTPLEILTSADPSHILSVLHNSITMHKRIIGTRQKCTPSTRWRHCTYHCLQILSARILAVMCHGPNVQHKIVTNGHMKTLVDALDPNHDPVSMP